MGRFIAQMNCIAAEATSERRNDAMRKDELLGGCYVVTVEPADLSGTDNWQECALINPGEGAQYLTQYFVRVIEGETRIASFPGSEVVLFVTAGMGTINISGTEFALAPQMGVVVKPGEAFSFTNAADSPLDMLLASCPGCEERAWLDRMPENFDASLPTRTVAVDPSRRNPMADRFFQLFVDENMGSETITQFFGEIPKSKPDAHRHLYEEAMCILSGEGYFWTEERKAPVAPGDIIFLSRKQAHVLECTSDSGMSLVGLIYPQGSPAINY